MILQCFPLLTLVLLDSEMKFRVYAKQHVKVQEFRDFYILFRHENNSHLTFWRRTFFQILAPPVFKM